MTRNPNGLHLASPDLAANGSSAEPAPPSRPQGPAAFIPGGGQREPAGLAAADPPAAAAAVARSGILLVDDEPANLLGLEAVLECLQEPTVRAASGGEALRQMLGHDFAVILLDVKMPGLDGFDTAALIRQRPRSRSTPIIFLTALRGEDDLFRAYGLGAVDYLFKPVVAQVLRAKVAAFLELNRQAALVQRQLLELECRNREIERAHSELRQAHRELERSNAELAQFATIASHDLKEPLRTITSYTQLLSRNLNDQLDDRSRQHLAFAGDGARRMHVLIDDLLTYSKLGGARPAPQPVAMDAVLTAALAALASAVADTQAVVTWAALPTVRGDAPQIQQLVQNLIANALKFSAPPGPSASGPSRVRIHVGAERHGDWWRISIDDSGIGFEMKYLDRLFLPFQRLHTRAEYPGTGIGLAICKKVVERHGGAIWAESAPGQGATFFFTLPAIIPDPEEREL